MILWQRNHAEHTLLSCPLPEQYQQQVFTRSSVGGHIKEALRGMSADPKVIAGVLKSPMLCSEAFPFASTLSSYT